MEYVCVYIHTIHTQWNICVCTYTYYTHTVEGVCTYIHSGILLTHKEENLPFVITWMNLDYFALSNVNQRKTHIT